MNAPVPQHDQRPITIAIFAMGGEGGGVLADWLIDLAETFRLHRATHLGARRRAAHRRHDLLSRIVSAPAGSAGAARPVLALMPMPGDVDIVVASELMEAGRAIQRGLVTPDRTTLIASTNRVFAMTEKIAMADGRVDGRNWSRPAAPPPSQFHAFDMAAIAEATGSVISAVLFGALAGAGALPFPRLAFEARSGAAAWASRPSLAAFTAGFEGVDRRSAMPARKPHARCRRRRSTDRMPLSAGESVAPHGRSRTSCWQRSRHFPSRPRADHPRTASSAPPTIRTFATRSFISTGLRRSPRATANAATALPPVAGDRAAARARHGL